MNPLYINTKLYTTVNINPSQMNEKIYLHLLDNLKEKLERKCYKDYGYVVKIYDITKKTGGVIPAENPMAAAVYNVEFTCKLCKPIRKRKIVCKVDRITEPLLSLTNGPVRVLVTVPDRINKESFYQNQNKILKYKVGNEIKTLSVGDYVNIIIDTITYNDMDTSIVILGVLDSLSTEIEIQTHFEEQYNETKTDLVDYDDIEEKPEGEKENKE